MSFSLIRSVNFSEYCQSNYLNITGITTSSNGSIIFVSIRSESFTEPISQPVYTIIKSNNNGDDLSWSGIPVPVNNLTSIACSSDGNIVFFANSGVNFWKSTNGFANQDNTSPITYIPDTLPPASDPSSSTPNPNPEVTILNTHRTLNDISQVACDSTGQKLIMTTNLSISIYQSTDGGLTWNFIFPNENFDSQTTYNYNLNIESDKRPLYVASSSNGDILYAATNEDTYSPVSKISRILRSTNSGVTWSVVNTNGLSGYFNSIVTNDSGDCVFVNQNVSLHIFYPDNSSQNTVLNLSGLNSLGAMSVYNNNNLGLVVAQNSSDMTTVSGTSYGPGVISIYSFGFPCFKEDSKILCLKEDKEVYVKIQDIRKGDLVKTLKKGYVSVNMIGTTNIYHPAICFSRNKDQLYRCSQKEYPELFEDLVITGSHSILVDKFTNDIQRLKVIEINGSTFITDGKYRLPACADLRSSVYENKGHINIYHLALDNDDYFTNYGIWANGLLVESCSKHYLNDLSNMTLL